MKKHFKQVVMIACFVILFPVAVIGEQQGVDHTMLMFVGEDDDILTIASGREESAWQAPAVASVLEQEDFRQKHYATFVQAIDSVPGFHVKPSDSGIRSYLRGIPESVLYLYDTVPINSVSEISLHSIKRIEIVRGPGSVLWGPDAFAGIVNVVPMTGKDLNGSEAGMLFSSHNNLAGGYINKGWKKEAWDAFVSISAGQPEKKEFSSRITRFWGDGISPAPLDDRRGWAEEEQGHQVELTGNFSYKDILKISGRFSDSNIPYSLSYLDDRITWKEVKNERAGFLKVEGKKRFGIDSALRFTGTVSMLDSDKQVIDKDLAHDITETYGEMTYERVFNSGSSHLTAGISFRDAYNKGVSVWDSFLPDYLVDENTAFLPRITQNDYETKLWSAFTQYQMSFGELDLIFGVRHDEHDSFEDNFSYNTGLVWKPSETLVWKALLGTAYRTPSAKQLFENRTGSLEEIKNFSLEGSKKIGEKFEISMGGFINRIENHILMDDPYAGLSIPNSQEIYGVEMALRIKPFRSVVFSAGLTLLNNRGPLESYLYNDYSIILPDGSIEKHYVLFEYPYDTGPRQFLNADVVWQAAENIELFAQAKYFSGYRLVYAHADEYRENGSAWIMDIGFRIKNFILDDSDLEIQCKNILDTRYQLPGHYNLEDGEPMSINIVWRKRW